MHNYYSTWYNYYYGWTAIYRFVGFLMFLIYNAQYSTRKSQKSKWRWWEGESSTSDKIIRWHMEDRKDILDRETGGKAGLWQQDMDLQ